MKMIVSINLPLCVGRKPVGPKHRFEVGPNLEISGAEAGFLDRRLFTRQSDARDSLKILDEGDVLPA